ncbi:MAG TPA: hypothetical protein DEF00_03905 [Candidatus Taylorbacteria bacterium]|nr:MAG: NUDIX hydrolase [Parcubacteria group bacterium GW2011_GWA2_47_64]KKU96916.1 MAG: NUDIX hydrolase [Parcubacteria group bacterium GW2011_GWC2_48_17]HBV01502.1 hypothetical protein [Candidatus Taylorbacteria bacterium]
MSETELIDVVDKDNNIIGESDVATAHAEGLRHRIAGVFVFDADGNLYLQTGNKYGKCDLSVGGHVRKGESYEDAAKREMLEEIGLTVPIQLVSTFFPTDARLNHFWTIYTANAPMNWKFKPTKEVWSLEKMKLEDVIASIHQEPKRFTHGFVNAMREYIRVKRSP